MQELTKAEEQIMQVIWDLDKCFVKEILPHLPKPTPAYNTVSTIVRILEKKGFVDYEVFGKSHRYYPVIDRETYKTYKSENLLKNYFEGSVQKMMSFFVKENKLDIKDIDEILKELK